MKKRNLVLFVCILLLMSVFFAGCSKEAILSFETNGAEQIDSIVVEKDEPVSKLPADPVKEGFYFGGWYYDKNLQKPFSDTEPVSRNFTLYAKWCHLEKWEVVTPATCTQDGLKEAYCVDCNQRFTEKIDAIGHDFGEWGNNTATCTEAGEETRCCQHEGCTAEEKRPTEALNHDFGEWTVTTNPTCTEDGEETRYCQREGCEEKETRPVEALNHDFGEWTVTTKPTCTEGGEETRYCRREGCEEKETRPLDALNHDFGEWTVTTQPTCTEAGEETRCCQREGCEERETRPVDALGHNDSEWEVTQQPDEFDKGMRQRTCSRCSRVEKQELDYTLDFPRVFLGVPTAAPDPLTEYAQWANWWWDYNATITVRYESTLDDAKHNFECYALMKIQGGLSKSLDYVKKNYTIKLFSDAGCTKKFKTKVVDSWGKQSKYVLKANWIDVTSARNLVTAQLWSDIVASRSTSNVVSEREYLDKMVHNGAVDGFPVMLYINNKYFGLYTFNIPKDNWLFGMKDDPNQALIFADDTARQPNGDYWHSTSFQTLIDPAAWDANELTAYGWELEYIMDESNSLPWVDNINNHIQFIVDTYGRMNEWITDAQKLAYRDKFRNEASQYFDVGGCIDYIIFLHIICGFSDNANKNVIWSTYDGRVWSPNAYDLDTTWGMAWNGSMFVNLITKPASPMDYAIGGFWHLDNQMWSHTNLRGNNLCDAFFLFFADEMEARYAELRADGAPLSYEHIEQLFSDFIGGIPEVLYQREAADFPTRPSNQLNELGQSNATDLNQILTFAAARLQYFDNLYYGSGLDTLGYNQTYFANLQQ